jgi:hypothetical protein
MCCVNAAQGPVMHVAHSTDHDSSHRFNTSLVYKTVYRGVDQLSGSSMRGVKEACRTAIPQQSLEAVILHHACIPTRLPM